MAYQDEVWIEKHTDAVGGAIFLIYEIKADPNVKMCGSCQGMLYVNHHKELCLATWSTKGEARVEMLLDRVDAFKCRLFDPKKGEWAESWPVKKEEVPQMLSLVIQWGGKEIPFVFFLNHLDERIIYPSATS